MNAKTESELTDDCTEGSATLGATFRNFARFFGDVRVLRFKSHGWSVEPSNVHRNLDFDRYVDSCSEPAIQGTSCCGGGQSFKQ